MRKPEDFGVTKKRGFLPKEDPLEFLPTSLWQYDEFLRQLPDFLGAGLVRKRAQELDMPKYSLDKLNRQQQTLLKMRLDYIVSAFRWEKAHRSFGPEKYREPKMHTVVIPKNISKPLFEVSGLLDVLPVLSYSFYCLNNWARIEKDKPPIRKNTRLLQHFTGTIDEDHFILIHTEIEQMLAGAVYKIFDLHRCVIDNSVEHLAEILYGMAKSMERAVSTFERMYEWCHPDIYYIRVRPYIFGYNVPGSPSTVIFSGVENQTPALRGETGAQTPSWPALWAALGINFPEDDLKHHVSDMRHYLMPEHREFIRYTERGPSVRDFTRRVIKNNATHCNDLEHAYNECVYQVARFFELHARFASEYIYQKAGKYTNTEQGMFGTGATPHMKYLNHHVKIIKEHFV